MLFADSSSEGVAWVVAIGAVLAGGTKFVLDLMGTRFSQKQVDRDKAFAEMGIILTHAQADIAKLEGRLDKLTDVHAECERRASFLERELIRNGIEINPYTPPGSGPHRPLVHEDDKP